jgi:hypothetical protein
MRASLTLVLLACLALAGPAAAADDPLCVSKAEGGAAAGKLVAADDLPYSVEYTSTADTLTTTFHFKVCSTGCTAGSANCEALKAFRLRLSDKVLAAPSKFIKSANPQGAVVAECAAGPGWWIKDGELSSLASSKPEEEQTCELFTVAVYNPAGATEATALSAICQQNLKVAGADGKVLLDQATEGASCVWGLELADGTTGFGTVQNEGGSDLPGGDDEPAQSPEAAPTKPPAPAPEPEKPSKPEHPSGGRGGYYGHRRLAGYRKLSGYRRSLLSDGEEAFSGRQLTGYRRLQGYRKLSGYRRSLLSDGEEAFSGRQLTGYRRLQGYRKLSGYRRSLLSDGKEAFSGRQLTGYRKLSGYRRSLLSEDSEAFSGRQLTGYRKLSGYRRSLLSDDSETFSGRQLTGYRRLQGYRKLSGYRRSLLSDFQGQRQLLGYRRLQGYRRSLSGYRKLLGADIEEPITLAVRRLLDATFVPLPSALIEAEHTTAHVSPVPAAGLQQCYPMPVL